MQPEVLRQWLQVAEEEGSAGAIPRNKNYRGRLSQPTRDRVYVLVAPTGPCLAADCHVTHNQLGPVINPAICQAEGYASASPAPALASQRR